jgi:hypothetical protein
MIASKFKSEIICILLFCLVILNSKGETIDSLKSKTIIDFVKTFHHGIDLKQQRYSQAYAKLDEVNKRRIAERYDDFLFDSLYPTISLSIDSLCAKFNQNLAKELLNYLLRAGTSTDETFDIELARLYLCKPEELEKYIQKFSPQEQKALVDFLPNGWNRLKQDAQNKIEKIDSLSSRLVNFHKRIMEQPK